MNVHTLIHYVDGVINLGPLWSQSTFAFHNGPSKPDKQVSTCIKYIIYYAYNRL